jgi:hypothetical protein
MLLAKALIRLCPFDPFDPFFSTLLTPCIAALGRNGNSRSGWH